MCLQRRLGVEKTGGNTHSWARPYSFLEQMELGYAFVITENVIY